MKKSLLSLSILVFLFALTGCADDEIAERGEIHAEILVLPFEESVNKADLIAEIEILDKVKEINDPFPITIFTAYVNDVLKEGKKPENNIINVVQQGTSNWVFNKTALFNKGDSLILLLKEHKRDIKNGKLDEEIDEYTYWIVGEETGMYQVVDQSKLIKLSLKEEALKSIELPEKVKETIIKKSKPTDKEIQFIDKNLFKQKIEKITKKIN